jgi:hypothetical protein
MEELGEWVAGVSMMLAELVQKAEEGDRGAVSEICETIEGQLSRVIALEPQDTH